VTLRLLPGSVIRVETSGGGGFGDPLQRSAEAAQADVLDGRIPSPVRNVPLAT